MTGKTEMQPALPHLPDRLADDLDVLRELASQMEIHVEAWDEIYHQAVRFLHFITCSCLMTLSDDFLTNKKNWLPFRRYSSIRHFRQQEMTS